VTNLKFSGGRNVNFGDVGFWPNATDAYGLRLSLLLRAWVQAVNKGRSSQVFVYALVVDQLKLVLTAKLGCFFEPTIFDLADVIAHIDAQCAEKSVAMVTQCKYDVFWIPRCSEIRTVLPVLTASRQAITSFLIRAKTGSTLALSRWTASSSSRGVAKAFWRMGVAFISSHSGYFFTPEWYYRSRVGRKAVNNLFCKARQRG